MIAMKHSFSIESKSENLPLVEKCIDDVCNECQLNEDYYGNVLIAVTEAVNNAIHHGNKSNPGKNVHIEVSSNEEQLVFSIKDEGEGFNYDDLPDPTDPANIEKPHGRGVFLMRNLSENLEFEDDGRIAILYFNIK